MKVSLVCCLLLSALLSLVKGQDPVNVYVSIYFNSVTKVDGVEQSFNADFYLTSFWLDTTLSPNDTAYDPNVNFNPSLEFANSRGGVTAQIDEPYSLAPPSEDVLGFPVPTGSGVWVKSDQRYVGDFNTVLNLIEFPFDFQDVVLQIESSLWDQTTVVFIPVGNLADSMLPKDDPKTSADEGFSVLEWTVRGAFVNQTSKYYKSFDQTYSRLEVKIFLERQSQYYLWKIILGSILLVIMCVCTFMLEVEEPDRMMGTLTIFLAIISFLFVATQSIPKVAYQTRLDNFFNFSFFVVFFILIAHTLNYFLRPREEVEAEGKDIEMKAEGEKGEKGKAAVLARFNPKGHSLSRKLDLAFAIIFLIVYAIGCLVILIAPGAPQYVQDILDGKV